MTRYRLRSRESELYVTWPQEVFLRRPLTTRNRRFRGSRWLPLVLSATSHDWKSTISGYLGRRFAVLSETAHD